MAHKPPMAPRILTFLILCGLTLFIAHQEESRGDGKRFETIHLGWLHANSGIEKRHSKVLLVALDDGDAPLAERIFQSWPLSELDYALLFENLFQSHPRALAVEPVLSWPPDGAPFLQNLADRLQSAPPTVLATLGEHSDFPGSGNGDELRQELDAMTGRHLVIADVSGDRSRVPELTAFLQAPTPGVSGDAPLAVAHIDLGENIVTPGDGTLRVPLLARAGETLMATFPLAALLLHRSVPADAVSARLGDRIALPGLEIPIDEAGRYALDLDSLEEIPVINARLFALPLTPGEASATAGDANGVITGLIEADKDYRKLGLLRTHLAVLGRTDRGAHRFPVNAAMGAVDRQPTLSRAEVFCQAIAAMDTGRQLRKAPPWTDHALGAAAAAAMLFLLSLRRSAVLKAAFLGILLLAMASLIAFEQWHCWFPVFKAMVVLACGAAVAFLVPCHRADAPHSR